MSQHPDDRTQGEPRDPEGEAGSPDHDQDLHPAVDLRESTEPVDSLGRPEAPPLDIDDRETASTGRTAPEVIELSEHLDVAGEETTFGFGRADEDQAAANEISDEPGGEEATNGMKSAVIAADGGPNVDIEDNRGDPIPPPGALDSEGGIESGEVEDLGSPTRETADPAPSATLKSKASSRLSGAASRLGLGKLLETTEETGQGAEAGSRGADQRATSEPARSGSRLAESLRSYLDPRPYMFSTVPHRRVLAAGIVLILLCLLANSGGLALIVLSAIVPILIVITLTQHDVFEKESNLLVAAVGAGGAVVGIVLSLLSTWLQASQWFDTGVLNFGAAGFGGRFADAAGSAPFIVWSLVGLVIPAVAVAGIAGIPIGMRRWPQFRNEVMDGVILTGASAAGFSIGACVVYWWPMIAEPGPQTNVSDWTLSIISVTLLRSAVITLCGAMIGAGIWRYMVTPAASVTVLPAVGGVVGYLLLTFGSIQLQATGNWLEFLWIALLLAAVFVLYRRVLDQAVITDRRT
ncbi:MAG: hypothetical protein M3457_21230, partial [Chloroflexota bacterium]|nr:hypothetical protein [Chloroflexota bacterium]